MKRYWPGKAPEWADEAEEDADIRTTRQALDQAFPLTSDSQIAKKDDPRLRRLAESRVVDREEVRADHRRIRQAEIISTEEEESRGLERAEAEEEDEDALEERRRRIREKLLLQRRQEEETAPPSEEVAEEEESEESESEYETDSDDEEDVGGISLVKPVFVPKSERDTIAERERLEAEELALEEAVRRRLEERKVETKQIVVEKIREEREIQKNMEAEEANIADVETDDELNEAEEYESWKAREIARIKRDREAREAMVREKEEIEKVRNMTEEERREWERKNPRPAAAAPKQKWRFMQKYYHKGAFFQEDADDQAGTAGAEAIYTRDFSAPTGEDRMDKTILPKVMQVKHFGRSGRTKWTHLVNEDTTDWNNPWTYNDPLRAKYNAKMAGMNKPIEKPKGSKKLKDWESR